MFGSERKEIRELDLSSNNLLVDVLGILRVIEGRIPRQQLINQDPYPPVIHRFSIPHLLIPKYLRRKVLRSPTKSVCPARLQLLREPQINNLCVP